MRIFRQMELNEYERRGWRGGESGLPDHDVEAEIVRCGAPLHPLLVEDDDPRDKTCSKQKNNDNKTFSGQL
jgi:hypothetical protein